MWQSKVVGTEYHCFIFSITYELMELDQVFHCHVTRDYQRANGKRWGIVEMNLKNRWLGMQDAGGYSRNGHIVSFLSTSIIMVIDLLQKPL
jgi:hypothetical protein